MQFDIEYALQCVMPILEKLPVTMEMTLIATLIALVIGAIFAVLLEKKIPVVTQLLTVLCSFLKGIPVLAMLYVFYYSMPIIMGDYLSHWGIPYDQRNPPKLSFAIIAFSLSYVPYMCDMIRSAYQAVPKGQMEACLSVGMSKMQAMRSVIIPQLTAIAIPNFGNHFVNLLKMTSLAYMVSVIEMMGAAKNFAVKNQRFLETYVVAALIFWVVFLIFEQLFRLIEKYSGRYRNPQTASAKANSAAAAKKVSVFGLRKRVQTKKNGGVIV